jgi:hypothetical protein
MGSCIRRHSEVVQTGYYASEAISLLHLALDVATTVREAPLRQVLAPLRQVLAPLRQVSVSLRLTSVREALERRELASSLTLPERMALL